jgi:hypothetical protein
MLVAGTRAPSKMTSPNSLVMPLIIFNGRGSTPGWCIDATKAEVPLAPAAAPTDQAREKPTFDVVVAVRILWV